MTLAFDARFLVQGGVHPHSRLVHVLLRQNSISPYAMRIVLYTDRPQDAPILEKHYCAANLSVCAEGPTGGRIQRLYWLNRSLPRALKRDGASVFYSSFYFLPPRVAGVRLINTIHDCCVFYIDPKLNRGLLSSPSYLWILKRMMRRVCRRADATMTVSQFSKRMLNRHLGLPLSSIRVCYHGLEPRGSDALPERKTPARSAELYFLFVGSNLPKKNIRQCIAGFARLPAEIRRRYKLRLKTGCYPEDRAQIERLGLGDRVEFIDRRMDEREMAELFEGASLLLLLSYDEGFGLPIIEAFGAGVPVLVSDRAACGEIVTLPECKADPDDTGEIASKWLALVEDRSLRERCLSEQRRILPQFTCGAAAKRFYDALTR